MKVGMYIANNPSATGTQTASAGTLAGARVVVLDDDQYKLLVTGVFSNARFARNS